MRHAVVRSAAQSDHEWSGEEVSQSLVSPKAQQVGHYVRPGDKTIASSAKISLVGAVGEDRCGNSSLCSLVGQRAHGDQDGDSAPSGWVVRHESAAAAAQQRTVMRHAVVRSAAQGDHERSGEEVGQSLVSPKAQQMGQYVRSGDKAIAGSAKIGLVGAVGEDRCGNSSLCSLVGQRAQGRTAWHRALPSAMEVHQPGQHAAAEGALAVPDQQPRARWNVA